MSVLVIAINLILGLVGGLSISFVTLIFPRHLQRQWRNDAYEYLSLPRDLEDRHTKTTLDELFSIRSTVITTLTTLVTFILMWQLCYSVKAAAYLLLAWSLVVIAVIDYETLYIPDAIVIPLVWAGLLYTAVFDPGQLQAHVLGAAIGYCVFRWLPVGPGDAKLCAAAGAWLGTQSLFTYFLIGSVVGALVGIGYYLARGKSEPCPFGPSLVAGFFVTIEMNFMNFQPLKLW